MSNNKRIKIDPGLRLMAGTMLTPDAPTPESLKEAIFGLVLNDDDEVNFNVLRPLVKAYSELLTAEAEESDTEVDFVSDADDYAAEKLYREFAIKGWRQAVGAKYPEATKSRSDEEVYEGCAWYEYGKMTWPTQLIAEVGYVLGYRDGRNAIAMSEYFAAHKEDSHV